MKSIFNCLKGVLFLLFGAALLIIPYSRFKEIFPAAPAPLWVRILGVVIVLCGIVILAAAFMYRE
ncbi:MAG: hypothetical protein K2G51_10785 [Lachnospiraceae bacterium]|nr:hypothetical protein [Lachnospiraceae bacterium]